MSDLRSNEHHLSKHCYGIAEVMGSNPVHAWIFFRPYFHYCPSSVHYCKDRFHIHNERLTTFCSLFLDNLTLQFAFVISSWVCFWKDHSSWQSLRYRILPNARPKTVHENGWDSPVRANWPWIGMLLPICEVIRHHSHQMSLALIYVLFSAGILLLFLEPYRNVMKQELKWPVKHSFEIDWTLPRIVTVVPNCPTIQDHLHATMKL